MSTPAAPPVAPEPAPLSEASRIINTFIAPSKTFLDLKRKVSWTSWVAPWLLITVMTITYASVVGKKVGFEQIFENNLSASPKQAEQLEKLPAQQQAQQRQISVAFTKGISYGFSLLILIGAVIVAGLLMATFNFGVGAEIPFKTALAIVMYSSLVAVITDMLAIVSLFAGSDPAGFFIQNPIATNAAYFMKPGESPALYAAAASLDAVSIWKWTLYALGFSYVSKMSKGTTLAVAFGWFLFLSLIGIGFAALFS